eukprot:TRINITY_DN15428_c0_g2_i1.p1 TRINITY_DN15428_c0_g2~~TRINITY_DN15428_c0_g2_i1.p1  ORF type:complete len:443 (-),score=54.40 TRINITY_DN15428_c0_g2_i1:87-1415(-)
MTLLSALLFPSPTPSYNANSFPDELLWIPWDLDFSSCTARESVPAIFLHYPHARYILVYFHSNGEDIGTCYTFGCGIRTLLEAHVLLVEYPSYGIYPGSCSQETLWRTAETAYKFVREVLKWCPDDIIIMGRSLGAALAVHVAERFECHGLVLVAPFLSLVDAFRQYIGGVASLVIGDIFNNSENISCVRVPTLVIHGQKDHLVACTQGRQLLDRCPASRKMFVNPANMGHNDDLLSNQDFFLQPMLRFFSFPDYYFGELNIPRMAFDKRWCLEYHSVVEMVKSDRPLQRTYGDQEPCPQIVDMDDDDDTSCQFPGLQARTHGRSDCGREDTCRSIVDEDIPLAARELPRVLQGGATRFPRSTPSAAAAVAAATFARRDSGDAASTAAPSSSSARSNDVSLLQTGEDSNSCVDVQGVSIDIDAGIVRFLKEGSFIDESLVIT